MRGIKFLSNMVFIVLVMLALPGPLHSGERDAKPFGDGDFLPGFARYLEERPLLSEGGGTIVAKGGDWLALGVGVGLRSNKEQSEYSLWKLADYNALKSVAEALEGSRYSGSDSASSAIVNPTTAAAGIARESSAIVQEISGIVSGSREVGRWKSNDGKTYHVMRAVFSPGHPLTRVRTHFPAREVEIDEPWRDEFLSRAFLRNGGADIATVDGGVYLLVAGVAPLKDGSPSVRINASRVADIKARANLLAFYDGVRLQSSTAASAVKERIYLGNSQSEERIEEKLQSRTSAQIKGIAGRMKNVGGWLSAAGNVLARAYVVDVDDL